MTHVEEISIVQGTTWQKAWLVRYSADITQTPLAYIDDTWTARCQIRNEKHGAILQHQVTASVTAAGAVVLLVTPAESTPWTWTQGYYDVEIVKGGVVQRVAEGVVVVDQETTV